MDKHSNIPEAVATISRLDSNDDVALVDPASVGHSGLSGVATVANWPSSEDYSSAW